jgi:hypothetical protein
MRSFLIFIGWASLVGSVLDSAITLFTLWIIADGGWTEPGISVETLLRVYFPFIYWVKQIAFLLLPDDFVAWIFSIPALIMFPARAILSTLIGAWALSAARRMIKTA